jgi:Flp pilus assembly pilin Flp
MNFIKRLWNDDEAANAVEYGLITAVIAVALIAALLYFRGILDEKFRDSADHVKSEQPK